MALVVHGNVDAGMAQLFLHIDRIFALAQQQAGVGMPDVMQPHLPDPGLAQYPFENAADIVLFHKVPVPMEVVGNRLAQPCLQCLPLAFEKLKCPTQSIDFRNGTAFPFPLKLEVI
jgi:hypothetical protein